MPEFEITSPDGRSIIVEGETAPNPQQAALLFQQAAVQDSGRKREDASPLAMTFDEFKAQAERDDMKGFSQKAGEFVSGLGQGVLQLIRMGGESIVEAGGAALEGDFEKIGKTGIEAAARGGFDLLDFGEAVTGRIGDAFVSDEEALQRQFARHQQDVLDQEKRSQGLVFSSDEVLPSATEVGSFLLDPTNLIGIGAAGKVGKLARLGDKASNVLDAPNKAVRAALDKGVRLGAAGTGKALTGAAKVLDAPLRLTASGLDKTGRIVGLPREAVTNITGKALGMNPSDIQRLNQFTRIGGAFASPIGQAEVAAKLGAKAAEKGTSMLRDAGQLLNIIGDKDRQYRFIRTAIEDPKISSKTRNLLRVAGNGTQKGLDLAFNAAANGLTTASIQAIMAKMATDDPEAIGSAFGGGLLLGGAIPVGQTPGQLNRLPNGNIDAAFMRVQNDLAHSRALEILKEKDKSAYDLFNQLAASGVESNVFLFDKQTFKDHFRADVGENANGRGFWEDENGDMYIDVQSKDGVPKMVQELGVRISRDLLDKSPELKRRVKEELDPDGALDINEVADRFVQDRMKSVLTGKLTGSTVRSKFSKDPDTLRLVEFTTEALLNKLGILDPAGNVRDNMSQSQLNIFNNNELVKNANNNLNIIRAARRSENQKKDLDIDKENIVNRQEQAYEAAYEDYLANNIDILAQATKNKDIATDIKTSASEQRMIDRFERDLEAGVKNVSTQKRLIERTVGDDRFELDDKGNRVQEEYVDARGVARNRDKLTPLAKAWRNKKIRFIEAAKGNRPDAFEVRPGQNNIGTKLGALEFLITGKKTKDIFDKIQDAIDSDSKMTFNGAQLGTKRRTKDGRLEAEDSGTEIAPMNWQVGSSMQNPKSLINVQGIDIGAVIARGHDGKGLDAELKQISDLAKQGFNISNIEVMIPEGQNRVVDMFRNDFELGNQLRVWKSFDPHNWNKATVLD